MFYTQVYHAVNSKWTAVLLYGNLASLVWCKLRRCQTTTKWSLTIRSHCLIKGPHDQIYNQKIALGTEALHLSN